MTRYRIEQAMVSAVGVLLGVALAMLIAPGDLGLWVVIALILAVFCRAFFIRGFCGELVWPLHHHHGHVIDPTARRH